jgi:chaperonin GroES
VANAPLFSPDVAGAVFGMEFAKIGANNKKHQKRNNKMIKPLADRIVVKPAEAEQKTSSGLFIPDNAKEKPMQGKVVAVGPGRKNDKGEIVPMEVKVGDVVLYGKYSGTEVTVDGENYLIVKEPDVIATL